jgi:hypothetical protein
LRGAQSDELPHPRGASGCGARAVPASAPKLLPVTNGRPRPCPLRRCRCRRCPIPCHPRCPPRRALSAGPIRHGARRDVQRVRVGAWQLRQPLARSFACRARATIRAAVKAVGTLVEGLNHTAARVGALLYRSAAAGARLSVPRSEVVGGRHGPQSTDDRRLGRLPPPRLHRPRLVLGGPLKALAVAVRDADGPKAGRGPSRPARA